jgi:HPt (histidine-containing phosphotransfer) domain-containing protein
MSSAAGFLDFFVLEASDYIEQLDGLLAHAGAMSPDADSLQRLARALRGSATMAKLPAFAELAGAVERIGRAMRDGALTWEPSLAGPLVSAIDDLKILVRAVRSWSPAEDQRASKRANELARLAPESVARASTPSAITGGNYFGTEAANIAAGLELLATRPTDREGGANVLRRVRALRGVAGIREIPMLAEVMEGAETATRPLELGAASLPAESVEMLRASAALLRRIATALREGKQADSAWPERASFERATETLFESERARDRIVPIDQLFFSDGSPNVVSTAPSPPTSPAERFRLEMVSHGEHLRGLVADVRRAPDDAARERLRRELRRSLHVLAGAAESFGEHTVATQLAAREPMLQSLAPDVLETLERIAAELSHAGSGGSDLAMRLAAAAQPRTPATPAAAAPPPAPTAAPPAPARATPASAPMTPRPTPAIASPRVRISGEHLATALDGGLAHLGTIANRALTPPAAALEPPTVPIQVLEYRGRAALERAIEIRDELRRAGGAPSLAALEELYALLDLALG